MRGRRQARAVLQKERVSGEESTVLPALTVVEQSSSLIAASREAEDEQHEGEQRVESEGDALAGQVGG